MAAAPFSTRELRAAPPSPNAVDDDLVPQRQTSSIGNDWTCIVCMERERAVRFEPCGHHVTCEGCAERLALCPMCRAHIGRIVFLSGDGFASPRTVYNPTNHELCRSCRDASRSLIEAAALGHAECVRRLLLGGTGEPPRPLDTDARGRTAVYAAAEGGHDLALLALLEVESYVPTVNKVCGRELRMRPMHVAAMNDRASTLQILHDHGAAPGTQDAHGATPLILAARVNAVEAVKLLLHLRVSTVHRDHDGRTALFNAVASGSVGVAALFRREMDAAVLTMRDNCGDTLLHAAASYPVHRTATDMVHQLKGSLFQAGHPVTEWRGARSRTPVHVAAANGNVEILRSLQAMVRRSDPDEDGNTPLHLACFGNHVDVCKELAYMSPADRVIRNLEGYTPLMACAVNGHTECALLLLAKMTQAEVLLRSQPSHLTAKELASSNGHQGLADAIRAVEQRRPSGSRVGTGDGGCCIVA